MFWSSSFRASASCIAVLLLVSCGETGRQRDERREAAYRANNRGVAFMEQFAFAQAVDAFREAIDLDPSVRLAWINLPIALYFAGRIGQSASAARDARAKFPDAPQPPYILGLLARNENRLDEAAAALRQVLQLDPDDVGAKVYLALVYARQERHRESIQLSSALALEPYNATAAYNLGLALTRAGERDAGQRMLRRFEELRNAPYAVTYSQAYLEHGRYAEAIASTGAEPDLVSTADPDVMFVDAHTGFVQRPIANGGITLVDLEGDGDLDIVVAAQALQVLRNDGGRFLDSTADLALAAVGDGATGVVAGDFNNDARRDLLVLTKRGYRLFAQGQDGRFRQVDTKGGPGSDQGARAAAFVDVDHDGDLDILLGARLLRNNGNDTFADVTAAARLGGVSDVVAVGATDFDNRRDIDLVMVSRDTAPRLFRNLRDGSFADVAESVGLPAAWPYTALAVADVNKDGFSDMFFGRESAPAVWALSDGRGKFRVESAGEETSGTIAVQIFDYDNDGLRDLFAIAGTGARLLRNVGRGWRDQTDRAIQAGVQGSSAIAVAAGDVDGDGDTDVAALLRDGGLRIWRNDGGNRNRSLRVALSARVSNRAGVGARIEMRAGSVHQMLETASTTPPTVPADIIFGLGGRTAADTVRVLWPAGILARRRVQRVNRDHPIFDGARRQHQRAGLQRTYAVPDSGGRPTGAFFPSMAGDRGVLETTRRRHDPGLHETRHRRRSGAPDRGESRHASIGQVMSPVMRFFLTLVGVAGMSIVGLQATRSQPVAPIDRSVLDQYCVTCHNTKLKTAGLSLDAMDVTQVSANAEVLEKVVRKLRSGQMPPAGRPRPDKPRLNQFVTAVEDALDRAATTSPNPGRIAVRRLNRLEYVNAVRDLLALDIDPGLLPADNLGVGFDNNAGILSVTPPLIQRYMSAAGKISRLALGDLTIRPSVQVYKTPVYAHQDVRMGEDLPFGTYGGLAVRHVFPLDAEYVFRIRLQRNTGADTIRGMDNEIQVELNIDHKLVKRFTVGGRYKGFDPALANAIPEDDIGGRERHDYRLTADHHMEVRVPIAAGPRVVSAAFTDGAAMIPERVPMAPSSLKSRFHWDDAGDPGIDYVEISGPYAARVSKTTPSRQRIFACHPASERDAEPCARTILTALAQRAYRRPVGNADVGELIRLFKAGHQQGGFEAGIGIALEALLSSPAFLFRLERDPADAAPGTMDHV
jgi:tetratricopeptide (TPR) repeat protein